jgi:Dyp-type peroxidase family
MPPISDADLQDIQGVALGRFRKDHQDLLFVQLNTPDAARRLLSWLAPRIATAWEVRLFNELFSEIRHRTGREEDTVQSTWISVGISATGYAVLGVDVTELGTGEGANAFRAGMVARSATSIGDSTEDQPSNWLEPFQSGTGIDLVVIVASDDRDDLDARTDEVASEIQNAGAVVVYRERGATLPPPLTGHEHFGFKDGISQPAIDGFDAPPAQGAPAALAPGTFVLGQPTNTGVATAAGSLWNNGTFGVFRRLYQDVANFRQQAAAMVASTNPTLPAAQIEAELVGRWPSGTPLATSPGSDPGPAGITNSFDYANDPTGTSTPQFAHTRKVYPRNEPRPDQTTNPSDSHRMIRAGIPYGAPLPAGAPDDGAQRGLHFLAFMADLNQQFEFVQSQWANNPNFPSGTPAGGGGYNPPPAGPPDGCDPIIGSHNQGDQIALNQGGSIHQLPLLAETVRVTAGQYFIHPSISATHSLATGTVSSTPTAPVGAGTPTP